MWIIENKGKELAKEIEKQYNKAYEMLKGALAPLYDELLVFKEKGVLGIASITTQKSNLTKPTTNIPKPTFSTPKTSTSSI